MCGIAGVVGTLDRAEREEISMSMLRRIAVRGRERPRLASLESATVGCVRLPIVARASASQPLVLPEAGEAHVLNGEIYNFKELLNTKAHSGGDGDIAVLPLLTREQIEPTDLSGMFAYCSVSSGGTRALLARDHMGIKPLFIARLRSGALAFASEMKAFRGVATSSISEVAPGTLVSYEDRELKETRLPQPWESVHQDQSIDVECGKKIVREALTEAVRRQVPDDLPLALLCSGGVDSSVLTLLSKEMTSEKGRPDSVVAYVVGVSGPTAPQDVLAARAVCSHLRVPLVEVQVDALSLASSVSHVVFRTESFEPNVVRNSLLADALFERIARDHFRVAMCGEGADELFHGYADFLAKDDDAANKFEADLLSDLHRTQLCRVDRTSMTYAVETRVPFLDDQVIAAARRIPRELKRWRSGATLRGKRILREAFLESLPGPAGRPKATLSHGAGFGDVSMQDGPMEEVAREILSTGEKKSLQATFPEIDLSTDERCWYLREYLKFFDPPTGYVPPVFAKVEQR